jgi:hypothetical protein
MLNNLKQWFKGNKHTAEQLFLVEHHIEFHTEHGLIVEGVILNREWGERLEYLSNRRLKQFDDLKALYDQAMLINEKIDLEINTQNFATRIGNTEENLKQFKETLHVLNQYYREFKREKK